MQQESDSPKAFEVFAQQKLNNHLAELNTRYEEMKIDKDTLQKAYEEHRKIFEKELDDEIQSLNNNVDSKDDLNAMKNDFVSRLK